MALECSFLKSFGRFNSAVNFVNAWIKSYFPSSQIYLHKHMWFNDF